MKIYTKAGDGGTTSLAGGKRLKKSDLQIEAYGTVDELNSVLGVAIEEIQAEECTNESEKCKLEERLCNIQSQLFTVGGILATHAESWEKYWDAQTISQWTGDLEAWIDEYSAALPELRTFILPRGSKSAALLHLARTVCRRSERCICRFSEQNDLPGNMLESVQKFVNRLSDFFFISARKMLQIENKSETIWKSTK